MPFFKNLKPVLKSFSVSHPLLFRETMLCTYKNAKPPIFHAKNKRTLFFGIQKTGFHTHCIAKCISESNKLPVLDALVKKAFSQTNSLPLKNTAILYIHHPLQTSKTLIESLIELGASPKRIFVLGKSYSESKAVVTSIKALGVFYQANSPQLGLGRFQHSFIRDINLLWSNVLADISGDSNIKNILIMDHGGHALAFTPAVILENYKIVGIEKTTAGLINPAHNGLPFPLIEVASSAAKRILESSLIATAVVDKLFSQLPCISGKNLSCGVVGYGAIGKAITEKLLSLGHKVAVYDGDPNQLKKLINAVPTNDLSFLISFSDYIFGCTGRNISKSIDNFKLCPRDKTLISCSSEDKEFLSLLQSINHNQKWKKGMNPLEDIHFQNSMGAKISIIRGGFPVNFDHSGESVPANDIQLTRGLVLGGVLQAIKLFREPSTTAIAGNYKLDSDIQKFVVNEWLKYQVLGRFPLEMISKFNDTTWIAENSGGLIYKSHFSSQINQQVTDPSRESVARKTI